MLLAPSTLCLTSFAETQECLGAPVLRGPPAGQDERGGAAGADEATPEGLGPGAQEDPEPGRAIGPALSQIPQPATAWRSWLSMLDGAGTEARVLPKSPKCTHVTSQGDLHG